MRRRLNGSYQGKRAMRRARQKAKFKNQMQNASGNYYYYKPNKNYYYKPNKNYYYKPVNKEKTELSNDLKGVILFMIGLGVLFILFLFLDM